MIKVNKINLIIKLIQLKIIIQIHLIIITKIIIMIIIIIQTIILIIILKKKENSLKEMEIGFVVIVKI